MTEINQYDDFLDVEDADGEHLAAENEDEVLRRVLGRCRQRGRAAPRRVTALAAGRAGEIGVMAGVFLRNV
ncbi:MAG: hypothetical protein NOF05_21560 [Candidatus Accumulibacter phosphatis]|uniref:hypothetical protein n=1 Tax=Accumulibacter sp. TaxID=2053492 RepID=UPI001A3A182C|nr:hypothetical protein [Accumulibacter sp.]MBL8401284.1 hypothetical protein [Accumulibacter sp.]MCQ1551334.1 hypothetical protein [Candidatus Accumulibacter phosphatis]